MLRQGNFPAENANAAFHCLLNTDTQTHSANGSRALVHTLADTCSLRFGEFASLFVCACVCSVANCLQMQKESNCATCWRQFSTNSILESIGVQMGWAVDAAAVFFFSTCVENHLAASGSILRAHVFTSGYGWE